MVNMRFVLMGAVLAFASNTFAQNQPATEAQAPQAALEQEKTIPTPHQVVEGVTSRLIDVVKNGEKALKENPDQYFADVEAVMSQAMDFKFMTKSVMGKTYWKKASREQKKRFFRAFKGSLVQTLGKGMASFTGFDASVIPPERRH